MGYIAAFMGGAFVGVWVMCAMIAAGDADRREEEELRKRYEEADRTVDS